MGKTSTEAELPPVEKTARRRNREAIMRLFQGFVADFGNELGEKIIKHIVDQAGGYRVLLPAPSPDPLPHGCRCFRRLWRSICGEFGRASGRAIMMKFVELGRKRISFPDHEDMCRFERNRRIRDLYDGTNGHKLALRFRLCRTQIIRIINE